MVKIVIKPQIITGEQQGYHNADIKRAQERLSRGGSYKDLSTVILLPSRGQIPAKVVQNWFNLINPMNQKIMRFFMIGMEIGDAYNEAIQAILDNPELTNWKYILTIEDDNMPPPDGLIKLYESIEGGVDGIKYDVVSGLYWTKGEGGQPMIYGDPKAIPLNFIPQIPLIDTIQQANGLGMGFDLWRISMFKDKKIEKPWFKTCQEYTPGQGARIYTQDLYFFEKAGRFGYKFACDTRVKVGHYDLQNDLVW